MKPYLFEAKPTAQALVQWIRTWMQQNGNDQTRIVIGISGGKDSTVVAALCVEAVGKDRVIGVMMPNGVQADIHDSQEVARHLGIQAVTVNIAAAYQGLTQAVSEGLQAIGAAETVSAQYSTNTPARLRMATLYGIAGQLGNCRVVNTCNRSEDVQGYSTHYGDSVGDFSPISRLTTEEVVAIGDCLGLPSHLTHKTPSDGMCGKSDEDNRGWTYHEINRIIRCNEAGPNYDKIIQKYHWNKFKIQIVQMPHFEPGLPDFFLENFGI